MKNIFLTSIFTLFAAVAMMAQVTITGDITSNTTWSANTIYTLSPGFHYVRPAVVNGSIVTLTIPAGTIIKSNGGALVICRGARIQANGTAIKPIIFTSAQPAGSRNPGDWGGLLILGKAPINDPAGQRVAEGGIDPTYGLYGGVDAADNSGTLRYVRIEYAGIPFQPNNETNGLTLGGVGSGTVIEHVQVSYGGDDSFEWFGGNSTSKWLLAYNGLDDEFDTDYGFSGNVQFGAAIRNLANVADISGSNGFESDNDATGTNNTPSTDANFSNFTFVGPIQQVGQVVNNNYKRGAHLRRGTKLDVFNSVFMGYPTGLKIEGTNTGDNVNNGSLKYKNNVISGSPQLLDNSGLGNLTLAQMQTWFNNNGNVSYTNPNDVQLTAPYNTSSPNLLPSPNSPLLTGADFTDADAAAFQAVSYRGAFGSDNWTKCWCEFDPQSQPYTTPNTNYFNQSISITGLAVICSGNSTVLTATAGLAGYAWSNGATTQSITINAGGTYTVTVSNARGCTLTASKTVTVDNAPNTPVVTPNGTLTFCQTGVVVNVPLSTPAVAGLTYKWYKNGTAISGATNATYTATRAGVYTVAAFNASGCSSLSAGTTIVVNAQPNANISGTLYICGATPRTYTATPAQPAANPNLYTYQWYLNGSPINGATSRTYTTLNGGNYSVSVTNTQTNCGKMSAVKTVNWYPSPVKPTVAANGPIAFPQGGSVTINITNYDPQFTYQWYDLNAILNGQVAASYLATTTGKYRAKAISGECISAFSSYINVVVSPNAQERVAAEEPADLEAGNEATALELFPNPTSGSAVLRFELSNDNETQITIFDMNGRAVYSENQLLGSGEQNMDFNVDQLSSGTYFVTVRNAEVSLTTKLVKE